MQINIKVEKFIATLESIDSCVVGRNTAYTVHFAFDSAWDAAPIKTARFLWGGNCTDVVLLGDECEFPMIDDVPFVTIGVYSEAVQTTTGAHVPMSRSILAGSAVPAAPTPGVYDQIISLLNETMVDVAADADRAETAAESASAFAATATAAATDATAAKTAAELAQTAAENAKTVAETARAVAESSAASAASAKTAAENAKTAAENAKTNAEAAQTAAETAADEAASSAEEIEDLTVSASGLPAGSSPTVVKTGGDGEPYNLDFGIPAGGVSTWTELQNKPFETLGGTLQVENGVLNIVIPPEYGRVSYNGFELTIE